MMFPVAVLPDPWECKLMTAIHSSIPTGQDLNEINKPEKTSNVRYCHLALQSFLLPFHCSHF